MEVVVVIMLVALSLSHCGGSLGVQWLCRCGCAHKSPVIIVSKQQEKKKTYVVLCCELRMDMRVGVDVSE